MLDSLTKSLDGKSANRSAEALIQKGLSNISGKMYQQAMIHFQKAHQDSPAYTGKVLNTEFNNFMQSGDYEAALSVGLVLIKTRPEDYELANILGNCARKQENFKQANNLYRHSLKIKKGYNRAFYNLAASMGKVLKYDDEVIQLVKKYATLNNFIIPDYLEDPEIQAGYEHHIQEFKEQEKAQKLKDLQELYDKLEDDDKVLEMRKVKADLMQTEHAKTTPKEEEIIEYFEKNIERKEAEADEDEEVARLLPKAIFDLGLYCISIRKGDVALECFERLMEEKWEYEYLDMCYALARFQEGETNEAIDSMIKLLGYDSSNRYLNINLGLMYQHDGNRLLSYKYLVIGAAFLERSEGLYKLSDLIRLAEESYEAGNSKRALALYLVISEELETVDPWISMGNIYLQMDKLEDAAAKYRKALEYDPHHKAAQDKLKEIHDVYFERGESFFRESKFKAAASIFEKALGILRLADTIKRTAAMYKLMRNSNKYEDLMEEFEELKEQEKIKENEKLRQGYIIKGRAFMARRQFNRAIENFELAFRMKLDKDVFMFLATLYKKMKLKDEMEDLLNRWNKMVEYEDRMKKFRKVEDEKRRKGLM